MYFNLPGVFSNFRSFPGVKSTHNWIIYNKRHLIHKFDSIISLITNRRSALLNGPQLEVIDFNICFEAAGFAEECVISPKVCPLVVGKFMSWTTCKPSRSWLTRRDSNWDSRLSRFCYSHKFAGWILKTTSRRSARIDSILSRNRLSTTKSRKLLSP